VLLVQAHSALGLAYELGEATALAYLTPKKENEVLLLAPTAGDDLFALLHHVLRAFIDDMSIFSFSLAFFFPAMDPLLPSLPALVRIVDRGLLPFRSHFFSDTNPLFGRLSVCGAVGH
jgi:hypothetical protein